MTNYYGNYEEVPTAPAFDEQNAGGALGWDSEIENESNFILLKPGEYEFQVIDLIRGYYNGGDKMGPCPKATVVLRINAPEGEVQLKHNLYLHTKCEGLLSAFFLGIGLKKHGERLRMDWDNVIGKTGRCMVGIRTYNGKEYNEVKSILDRRPGDPAPQNQQQMSFQVPAGGGYKAGQF